jgi:membrane protease YdiL (CAAX protease family)
MERTELTTGTGLGAGSDLREAPSTVGAPAQLTLGGILAVWSAATVPMGLLAWVVAPIVADRLSGPGALSRALILALTAGLVWQFVLVVLLVRHEQGTLRWPVVREALWLRAPRDPRTGRRGGRLWLIVPVLLVGVVAKEFMPKLPHPENLDFHTFLGTAAGHELLAGAWGWFAVLLVMALFNTVLGEELLFRGYLLPRMAGTFGRWDWLANGLLFAAYHVHRWWGLPGILLNVFLYSWPAKRYRSALVSIAVHSLQSVVLVVLVLPVVLQG